ncbi:MAG: hypothetical protein C4548_00120 [Desulfobacteraceae bacterium]|nr:MAG: hypothetical protein C4548_00120 [Desulfobacteraceae bacterium]
MLLNQDFKEFIELLNDNRVRYLVVGGYAVALHGHPRYTRVNHAKLLIGRWRPVAFAVIISLAVADASTGGDNGDKIQQAAVDNRYCARDANVVMNHEPCLLKVIRAIH